LSSPYQIVTGEELHQGDVLIGFPILRPKLPANWPNSKALEYEIWHGDFIILSQTCDLAEGPTRRPIENAIVCQWAQKTQLEAAKHELASKDRWGHVKKDRIAHYHYIGGDAATHDEAVVFFRQLYTMPTAFVRDHAITLGDRRRLVSPFREHLSQRFGLFFQRVAIPD
jgi:hypothetical protein